MTQNNTWSYQLALSFSRLLLHYCNYVFYWCNWRHSNFFYVVVFWKCSLKSLAITRSSSITLLFSNKLFSNWVTFNFIRKRSSTVVQNFIFYAAHFWLRFVKYVFFPKMAQSFLISTRFQFYQAKKHCRSLGRVIVALCNSFKTNFTRLAYKYC